MIHKKIDKNEKIKDVIGSKYVQSELGEALQEVKRYLNEDRIVLFSGTPCQVAGLKKFF